MNQDIKILKETKSWLVVDKPAGVVIHDVPGEKHAGKTIVDWFLGKYPKVKYLNWPDQSRPGIVHRLDQDTSGVLILAKTPEALKNLQDQFRNRTVQKTYQALVLGTPPEQGKLEGQIMRKKDTEHQVAHLSFPWHKSKPKSAETTYNRLDMPTFHLSPLRWEGKGAHLSLLELYPKTGRTHQLRVQLLDAGWPIIGDQVYSTKESREISRVLGLNRQFLHAVKLEFNDPETGERVKVESELARDLQEILEKTNRLTPPIH